MPDVVSLHGKPIKIPEGGNPHVVKMLEIWLERARAGQITEIALAGVYLDKAAGDAWAGDVSVTLIGSVSLMLHKIKVDLCEASRED